MSMQQNEFPNRPQSLKGLASHPGLYFVAGHPFNSNSKYRLSLDPL